MNYNRIMGALQEGRLGVSFEQLDLVQKECENAADLRNALLRHSNVDESELLHRAAEYGGTVFLELREEDISAEAIQIVTAGLVNHFKIMPVTIRDGALVIATSDPFNEELADEISLLLGHRRIELALATAESIARAARRHYGVGADTVEQMVSRDVLERDEEATSDLDGADAAHDASVIKLLNQIMLDAIQQRATDIHFEPFESDLRVRYRIDGVLREAGVPAAARHFRHAIVSRGKIISNLNIAERRLPQDGRAQVNLGGQTYDLRVSILPTPYGEALNMRILPRSVMIDDLSVLGFEGRDLAGLHQLIQKPHGIILVTGPTGSGKTTTLYTALKMLNKVDVKILTIEDPIEYRMRGLVQMQVNPEIGFTFATALRSMLRHDPDVMLIGEIRDYETAEITIRTALTGHLVFSTLHTNDAPTAMSRLTDMGVEPFLIASSVEGVLAQRLVRLICENCKEYYEPESGLSQLLGSGGKKVERLAKGPGCRHCRFTGYWGRTCITELMIMDARLREMVAQKRHSGDIRREAEKRGMQSLRTAGLNKLARGITTLDEILRVTPPAEDGDDIIPTHLNV